nr:MAG TPA: hypothetical protein [Caudoviricetes sp.]
MRIVKCKNIKTRTMSSFQKQAKSVQPQYDEQGLLLNPTEEQLYKKLKSAEDDYWRQRAAGVKMKNITCLADLLEELK